MIFVSLIHNFNQVQEHLSIKQVLEQIQDGTYQQAVTQVRLNLKEGNLEAYEQAKKSLPAFTPSGQFEGGRRKEHLQAYSGVVVLDLDKLSKEKLQQARETACALPFTYAAFVSPSGNGLKVLVKVASSAEAHKHAYSQVKEYYSARLGLKVDESGSDVTRLCFISFDPDLYLNSEAAIFPVNTAPATGSGAASNQRPYKSHLETIPVPAAAEEVYRHCVALTQRKYCYTEGSRNSFVHQLACNLNRYGVAQTQAMAFLLADYNFHEAEVTAAVRSAYVNVQEHGSKEFRPTIKPPVGHPLSTGCLPYPTPAVIEKQPENHLSLAAHHPEATSKPPFAGTTTLQAAIAEEGEQDTNQAGPGGDTYIDKIEEFLLLRYAFRYNVVINRQEYRTSEKGKWQPLSDRAESTMLRELKKAQVRVTQAELRMLLDSDFCPLYDPFKAHFRGLQEWDGERDYILELASTVTTTDQEQWHFCFKRWFVAMVAGVLDPQVVNHTLFVLSGGQGLGKTTWVLNLVPHQLQAYLYSGEINPGNKDTLQQLSENILINLDELENLNRSEIGALKEMVTKSAIKVRKAYGRHHEKMLRRASFAGSVNTAQFLNDTTGSRRFLCFEVLDIDYTHQVELDKVYAQAYHLYKTGFRFWFDKEEIQRITQSNERFQVRSVEEELLLTWFEKPTDNAPIVFYTATQLAAKLSEKAKINVSDATINKLGKALKKHGFDRVKQGGVYGYQVRELGWEEVDRKSRGEATLPAPPF